MVEKQKWHVVKDIPVAMIVTLLIQTAGAIWWAAQISAEVRYVRETQASVLIAQSNVDRRQDEEVKRAEDRILQRLDSLSLKMDRMIERKEGR